ncbi:MAG TPA: GTP cyclohydrolase I FolE [Burkholderiales bacterium]|nr:GTP cyclohydrolase I FolE [Burkholderiales bacterium]
MSKENDSAEAKGSFGAAQGSFGVNDWRHLLRSLGEDPMRQGLVETPDRASRAWAHWTRGYQEDPNAILKTFEDGSENYNQLIVVKRIPVYSHCEHHLAPFFGHAAIGYLPTGRIVGLSKLTRLVNCFAARLQVQERLTQQIAQSLLQHLQPKAVGVIIRCRHMCMESRGIAVAGEETVTSAMLGDLEKNQAQRAEFLALVADKD